MLASIHPLGERARGRRWAITVSAFIAGAASAGAAAGGLLGLAGATVREHAGLPWTAVGAAVVVLCLAGGLLDLGWLGPKLPSVRRQVNEDWLHRYRGGVYGFGFGFQLGLGVATIVTTAAVYVAYALAFLTGSALAGLAIGATFGSVRGLSVLLAARVEAPQQLWALHRRLQRWAPASRTITVLAQFAVVVAVLATTAT
jgi:MFS family permease